MNPDAAPAKDVRKRIEHVRLGHILWSAGWFWYVAASCLQAADRTPLSETSSGGVLDSASGLREPADRQPLDTSRGLREPANQRPLDSAGGLREPVDRQPLDTSRGLREPANQRPLDSAGGLRENNGGLREATGGLREDGGGILASAEQAGSAGGASADSTSLNDLRTQQAAELDRLRNTYDHRARTECPRNPDGSINKNSPEYKNLAQEYSGQHESVRKKYLDKLPADATTDGVRNTGSKRKDVRSDGDYTATDEAGYQQQKNEWEGRGDPVSDKGHKAVNQKTDETLWKPDPTGQHRDAKIKDPDAMGTPGGQKSVGDSRGITDAEGMTLDHEKKYLDGQERGNLKDQAKAVSKAGEKTGRAAENPDLYDQNRKLQNYGDDVTAGITDLGDTPAERQRKLDEFKKANDAEMERIKEAGRAQGERGQQTREDLRNQTRQAENAGDDAWNKARNEANYDGQKTTSEAIDDRIQQVNDANRATADQNQRTRERLEGGDTIRSDAPDGKPHTPSDTPEGGTRVATDTPDGHPRAPGSDGPDATPGAKPGKLGKAMDAAGKGMQAVDILATAEDAKQAIQQGDMKKLRGTLAEGADGLAGSPVATSKMVKDRLVDAHGDKNDAQAQARQAAQEAHEQEMRADLRKGGYSKDEVDRIMDARAKGDEGPLKDGYTKIGKDIPKPMDTDPTLGESLSNYGQEVSDNAHEVATGLADRGAKAGKLVKGAGEDVLEIGTGLTEKGVVDQIRENQKDNWTGDNLQAGAEHIYEKGKEAVGIKATDGEREDQAAKDLADKMIARGVDPKEARAAADRMIQHPGDAQAREHVRQLEREADLADKMIAKGVDPQAAREAADRMLQHPGDKQAVERVRELVREAQSKKSNHDQKSDSSKPELTDKKDSSSAIDPAIPGGTRETVETPTTGSETAPAGTDGAPRNDAGQKVDAGAYEEGDRIVTGDGREFERKDGQWTPTGQNYGAYPPGGQDLKGSEPAAGERNSDAAHDGSSGGGMDGFMGGREGRTAANSAAAHGLMSGQQDLSEASQTGDQTVRDARQAVNAAGQDARDMRDKSSAQTAAADRESSLGKAIADGVQQGVEQGLTSAGGSFGKSAADRASDQIFDDGHKGGKDGGGHGKKDGGPAGGKGSGPTPPPTPGDGHHGKGKNDDPSKGPSDTQETNPDGETDDASTGASDDGQANSPGDGSGHGKSSAPTVICPGCGARIKGVDGQGVECPHCVTLTCPRCGYSKNYPRGQEPDECPMCYTLTCDICGQVSYGRRDRPEGSCPNCIRIRCSGCGGLLYEGARASAPASITCRTCTERAQAAAGGGE